MPAFDTEYRDDDLTRLEAEGLPPLPPPRASGHVPTGGARIWWESHGDGAPLLLLHGGLGYSGDFTLVIPGLVAKGYRVIAIDSRGHGRSTMGDRPLSYWTMADDVRAVLDHLGIAKAAIVGWSDGADTGLVLAHDTPERVAALVFFACNVDPSGTKPFEFTPIVGRIFAHHKRNYARLSATPQGFDAFSDAVGHMQSTEPNYTAADLAAVGVPVLSLIGENDEFITEAHAKYIAATIPGARFVRIMEATHFAPLQRPALFTLAVTEFLATAWPALDRK